MTVEIREMVVRTTITGGRTDEAKEKLSCSGMEDVKREVLAICLERIAEYLERQKDR